MSDDVTTKIEPALTPEEWAEGSVELPDADDDDNSPPPMVLDREENGELRIVCDDGWYNIRLAVGDLPKIIALANAALPDAGQRKITRKTVAVLRELIDAADRDDAGPWGESWQSDELVAVLTASRAIIDALASYLPPA